jgi:predicted anti-sigma-YlaC factor YlaD
MLSELIALRLDNRLPAEQMAVLEAHLAVCPSCRRLAEGMARLDRLLRTTPMATPTRDLTPAILKAIAPHREQRFLGLTFVMAALLASVPSLLLVAGMVAVVLGWGRPDVLAEVFSLLMTGLTQFYALLRVTSIVLNLFDPWVLSGVSAAFGLAALGLTLFWGHRRLARSFSESALPA